MAVKYNKLLKLIVDHKMTPAQLANEAGVCANVVARLKRDQYISLETVEKICNVLSCKVDDILEFVPEDDK